MELVNVSYKGLGLPTQQYTPQDTSLITNNYINSNFGAKEDYIEIFIYDQNGQVLLTDYDGFDYYPYLTANPQNNLYSTLTLDPEKDVVSRGFNRGSINIQYNFFKKLFNSQYGKTYWIKEISPSRTELKLSSQVISDTGIAEGFATWQNYIATKNYYTDFYLNFGSNNLIIATNVAYAQDDEGAYLLIKLYEPLDADFDVKTQLWIVDKVSEAVSFNVNIDVPAADPNVLNRLRGPNYQIRVNEKIGQTTPYYSYNTLLTSNVTSSYQKMLSYYQDRSVDINVDYSDFSNFVHFSNASERVNNFVYKLTLIENYKSEIGFTNSYSGSSAKIASSSFGNAQNAINNIIEKFDPYEYFLYFSSGSWSWPKYDTKQPYDLYSVSSSKAVSWLGSPTTIPTVSAPSLLYSASFYDATNKDTLRNGIPQYLLDDPNNAGYITFIDMIGQHFDNIWIYYKDVTNKFDATNNPNTGISLDLVADALRGLGMELYTNTSVSDNVYYTLFGINQDGSLLPPTGSELITNYYTSSIDTLPSQQIQSEIYKRLYHNLPYLLKTRGTQRGVKALIACYGIPDTILDPMEFGGTEKASLAGIYDLDSTNFKINIATGSNAQVTGSLTISSSLLSPNTTIQYYQNNKRANSKNIEVGFSPSDQINNNISSSGVIIGNLDQYIGNPTYATSGSYPALNTLSNNYFQSYTQKHSIWEYIRLIKFYNNSLFKTIKDFVPARANVSTGIIVKSHMLERNKVTRHEPSMSRTNNFSQSIDTAFITASGANIIDGPTDWSGLATGSVGYIPFTSSKGIEKLTGAFGGTVITATTLNRFQNQNEFSSNANISVSSYVTYSLGALYQNVTGSVRSQRFFDLDYSYNQLVPTNYGLVTQSLSQSQFNNYNTYTNPNSPYAELQDYNYNLNSFTIPRYYGSKNMSVSYSFYTPGDSSYGSTAAIDKIKYQYAYLVDIYSSSFQMPGRSNAQIKYIIDNSQNVLDLTKLNNNIFYTQNIYKSGETVNISFFDYSPTNPDSQYLTNNSDVQLYEGGFRYSPILANCNASATLDYKLNTPVIVTTTNTSPGGAVYESPLPAYDLANWSSLGTEQVYEFGQNWWKLRCGMPDQYSTTISTQNLTVFWEASATDVGLSNGFTGLVEGSFNISIGQVLNKTINTVNPTYYNEPQLVAVYKVSYSPGGTTTNTTYTTTVSDSSNFLSLIGPKEIRFSQVQSNYYGNAVQKLNATFIAPTYSLEPPVFPIQVQKGDMIRLFNRVSSWNAEDEYRINEVNLSNNGYVTFTVDRDVNYNNTVDFGAALLTYSTTGVGSAIDHYVLLKHIPDETNLILNFNATSSITTDGLVYPQYLSKPVQENSGNVIKSLKQQNLI